MLESTRLDYLTAMGVINWVPRHPLPHAAYRIPALLPEVLEGTSDAPQRVPAPSEPTATPETAAKAVQAVRAQIAQRPGKPERTPAAAVLEETAVVQVVEPIVKAPPLEPFYLQLWMAGPCALLIETPEPGLESASPALRLLKDILRAVRLPQVPHLYSEFRWPLNRNPQFDRSAPAASLALQTFMQGRLENEPVVSIGCFGRYPALLLGPDLASRDLYAGAEQTLEDLPAAWFAPDLDVLMADPGAKRQLWQQLQRIMFRWQADT